MRLSSKFKAVSLTSLVIVIASSAAFLLSGGRAIHAAEGATQEAETLPVVKIRKADIEQLLELPGEFRPYQEVDLDAKVKGYVKSMLVDVGDQVKQGQLLAELEIPEVNDDLTRAKAAVERARQQVFQLQAIYADDNEMYKRLASVMNERPELVAQQDVDQAKAKADSAEAAWVAAKSAVDEAEAHKKGLTDMLAYTKIIAPFDGVITKRFVDAGALIGDSAGHGAGRSIVHLSQLDRLRLVIKIPESVVPKIHEGDLVNIQIPSLNSNENLPISRMSHQVDADTRTMHIEVDYPNVGVAITPGLYANVNMSVDSRHHVLSIPLEAVVSRKDTSGKVFVLHPDGAVESRSIRLGLVNATQAEILEGVGEGELVAIGVKPSTQKGKIYTARIVAEK